MIHLCTYHYMASFLSQPRQFTTYTPEVNSELYASLLQKKETDYKEGIQKVEASRDAVASLPIANLSARNYLQQKLDAQTTELNQQQGTDWSDQGIQRFTSKHITDIANDPVIQTAVGDTATYRRDYQKAKASYDQTNGADVANQAKFSTQSAQWINNPDVNSRYNGTFVQYQDINKQATDFLSKLKPDILSLIKVSDGLKGWEKQIRKLEGVNKQKLQDALDEFINTTPGIRDQMGVNAWYDYKDYDTKDYFNRLQKVNGNLMAGYQKDIVDLERQKLFTDDPDKVKEIQSAIDNRQQKYIPALQNYDYSAELTMFQHPQYREHVINDLYEKNWKYGILTANSGGDKYEEDYGGMSPRETYFKQRDDERADKKYLHDISQDDTKNQQWERHFKWEQDKENKTVPSQGVPLSPARTDAITDDYVALQQKAKILRGDVESTKIDLLSGMLASKGVVDNIGNSKYFDYDVATGKTTIKNGYIPLTDKASQFLAHPSNDMSALSYGNDYVSNKDYLMGFTDKQGRYHNGVIDNLVSGQSAGNYGLSSERAINLSMSDRQFLADLKLKEKDADAYAGLEVAGQKKLHNYLQTDPEAKQLSAELDTYFQPFNAHNYGQDMHFTRDQLNEFFRYYRQSVEEIKGQEVPEQGLDEAVLLQRKLLEKYGYDKDVQVRTLLDHFKGINQKQLDFDTKKSKFLGNWAKDLGVAPIINGVKLTNGKEEIVKDVSSTVQQVVNYLDPEAKSYDKLRTSLKKGTEGDKSVGIALGYDELKPETPYFYEVSGAGGKSERVYFTEQNALTLGVDVNKIKPVESPLARTLKRNGALYGTGFQSTVTPGKSNTWENADNIVMTKNNELRYVIEHPKGRPFVLYKYWMSNGKLQPREEEMFGTLEGAEKKLNELRNTTK